MHHDVHWCIMYHDMKGMLVFLSFTGQLEEHLDVLSGLEESRMGNKWFNNCDLLTNQATNHSKILTNYASIKLLRKNMQKQKLVVVKQILCRCISLNTTRIEDITEIAVIMFDFSKHLRDIFQGATWDVSAADLWQNCLWRFYLSCHGEHFLEALDLWEVLISFSAHMFLKDWSCAPWTVVGLIFGAMLFGVPFGQVNAKFYLESHLGRWTQNFNWSPVWTG